MPSTMIHLLAARRIAPRADEVYLLGCFAPDYTNDRAQKDAIHLRDAADRWEALQGLYNGIDHDNAFEQGWFTHLFTDACWDAEFYERYKRERGHEDGWFFRYREDIGTASFHLFHILPWARDAWRDILSLEAGDIHAAMPVDITGVLGYRDRVYKRHAENGGVPSGYYTDDVLNAFAADTAKRYAAWMAEHGRA